MKTCTFDGCDRDFTAKGYCEAHYKQWRDGKALRPLRPYRRKAKRDCNFDGCDRKQKAKGLCRGHYQQQRNGRELTILGKYARRGSFGPAHNKMYESDSECRVDGCTTKPMAKWLCQHHYYQLKRFGYEIWEWEDTGTVKEDERRCTVCRKVKHWSQFINMDENRGGRKECRDCYRLRILPPNEEPKTKLTTDQMIEKLGLQQFCE